MESPLTIMLVLVLTCILSITVYSVMRLRHAHVENQRALEQTRVTLEEKIKKSLEIIDLTDLAEFRKLDPLVKQYYKKYISGKIMPIVVTTLNQLLTSTKEYEQAVANPKEIEKVLDEFVTQLQTSLDKERISFLADMSSTGEKTHGEASQSSQTRPQSEQSASIPNYQQLNEGEPFKVVRSSTS